MATIKSKVISKLGQNNTTYLDDIVNIQELWSDTIWQTLTTNIPHRLMLGELNPSIDPTNTAASDAIPGDGTDMTDKEPLLVVRTSANHVLDTNGDIDSEGYIRKPVNRISFEKSYQALDADSIYFATNTSPVYWLEKRTVDSESVIRLYTAPASTGYDVPATGELRLPNSKSGLEIYSIERFAYPTSQPDGTSQDGPVTWDTHIDIPLQYTETGVGGGNHYVDFDEVLPPDGENLVVTKLALAIVNQKLANAAIQDEDQDNVALLQSQMKVLSEEVELEVRRLEELWSE
jgi:hypothetical protein